jgi:hypothetical protein
LTDVIPYIKLRAAYGKAGIQPDAFARYPVLGTGDIGAGQGGQLGYFPPSAGANANLNVEVSTEKEAGFDFTVNALKGSSFLNNINGAVTVWNRSTANAIFATPYPLSSGSSSFLNNAVGLASNGWQFQLNLPVYTSSAFNWDFTTNFGHQYSKITSIAGGADIILTSTGGSQAGAQSTSLVLRAGQPIGQLYGYKALTSLNYTNQEGTAYIDPSNYSNYSIVNGRVVDNTTKQIQFTNEKYALGSPNPNFNTSFINTFRYKDFLTLSFQFDWIHGSHLYNQTKEWMSRDGISGDFAKNVTINGETGAYSAYWSSPYYNVFGIAHGTGNDATHDYYWENSSFVRLRNVSLAFDIARVVKVPGVRKLQLVLTGRNLLTFTKYTGYDPEVSAGTVNSAFDRGVDNNTLPNIRSYQIGLNVGL